MRTELKHWIVKLSGGAPTDEIGCRKIIEAPDRVKAAQIALGAFGRAIAATTVGECDPDRQWRACDRIPWVKGEHILAGDKSWAVDTAASALENRVDYSSALAIVGAAREEVRKSMRGEPMDRQPIARVVALAGLLLSDARKREGVS